MNKQDRHLENLSEIRNMMERSQRFLSLSGLAGVFAGIFALIGAAIAWWYLDLHFDSYKDYAYATDLDGSVRTGFYTFFFGIAGSVLTASIIAAWYFSYRKAKKNGHKMWNATAKRLLVNMLIPLAVGGFFCIILLYHGYVGLVAPATLLFYGMALFNAGKYTLDDIRYLGLCQLVLGLLASVFIANGLIFWAIGFGLMHIVYGIVMYNKYER